MGLDGKSEVPIDRVHHAPLLEDLGAIVRRHRVVDRVTMLGEAHRLPVDAHTANPVHPNEIEISGQRLRVSISVGVAVFPQDGAEETALLGNADAAICSSPSGLRG